jgi:hypothetical protein
MGLAGLAWAQGDATGMEQELDLAAKSGSEAAWIVTTVRARNAFAQGQVGKGCQYYQQCQEIAGRINLPELQAGLFSDQATSEVIVGYKQPAITLAEKAIAVSKAPSSLLGGGLVMALAGQNARAEELTREIPRRRCKP